jgi:hypothetical protein
MIARSYLTGTYLAICMARADTANSDVAGIPEPAPLAEVMIRQEPCALPYELCITPPRRV